MLDRNPMFIKTFNTNEKFVFSISKNISSETSYFCLRNIVLSGQYIINDLSK